MSAYTTPAQNDAGTTPDDAPTLEPTLTTIVTEHSANGKDGEILAYDQYAAVITCATDTIHQNVGTVQ